MVFNSLEFFIFLPCVLLLYYAFPRGARRYILLFASYFFYAFCDFRLLGLILFTTGLSYACAWMIEKSKSLTARRVWLCVGLFGCLGLLFFFKYFNFLLEIVSGVSSALGGGFSLTLNIILPVGISFYTFQTLSYIVDVYRGHFSAERNFIYYALYISFFPQLVAGPIERPESLLPQLKAERRPDADDVSLGLRSILAGLFKKICVADILAISVNKIFGAPEKASGILVAVGAVLFAFQILCDFSGYSDIAVGCAQLFGVKLMQNFDAPYSSASPREFWSRWHISLSNWLRDYIYFPLGGSRVSRARAMLNLMIVFLASGLWHGAAWTFVLWGLFHGLLRVLDSLTRDFRDKLWNGKAPKLRRAVGVVFTFCAVTFSWIIFRAGSVRDLGMLLSKLFTDWSFSPQYLSQAAEYISLSIPTLIYYGVAFAGLYAIKFLYNVSDRGKIFRYILSLLYIWLIIGAWIYLSSSDVPSTFIYFRF